MKDVRLTWRTAAILAALALAGCGGSSDGGSASTEGGSASSAASAPTTSTGPIGAAAATCRDAAGGVRQLRVVNAECVYARGVAAAWVAERACQGSAGASRTSCVIGGLRCLGARTDQGIAVSCAQPGRSLSFVARRG